MINTSSLRLHHQWKSKLKSPDVKSAEGKSIFQIYTPNNVGKMEVSCIEDYPVFKSNFSVSLQGNQDK